jgi:hypothetical protein
MLARKVPNRSGVGNRVCQNVTNLAQSRSKACRRSPRWKTDYPRVVAKGRVIVRRRRLIRIGRPYGVREE